MAMRSLKLSIISLLVPASIFLTALTSFAGIYNYMEVVVGEKAAGMGGAFTAVADDATATYYNPAGIIHIPFNSMSASANAMTFKTRKGKFFLSNKEELTSFDFIPNFWGVTASTSIGKIGLSIVVPESDNFELHEKYSNISLLGFDWNTARDDIIFESDTYMVGPSYAFSVLPGLSGGVSLYFIYNAFTEDGYNYWDTDYTDVSDGKNYSLLWENSAKKNGTGMGVTGKIGFLYKSDGWLRIGAVFRPPSQISEEVKVSQVVYLSEISDDMTVVKNFMRGNAEGTVSYARKLPFTTTVGIAVLPSERTTISLDVSYFGPVEYKEKTITLDENLDQVEAQRDVVLNEVINGSLGIEYMLTPRIPLRAGLFTDISAAPEVLNVNAAQPAHIDKYGLTLSSGYMQSNSTVTAGIKYGIGRGYGTAPDYSTDDISFTFRKEKYTQTDISVFVSGTYMF